MGGRWEIRVNLFQFIATKHHSLAREQSRCDGIKDSVSSPPQARRSAPRSAISSCATPRGRPKRSSASARGGPSPGWSRSSSSTRRGRVDRLRGCACSSASPASTATRSRTPRASILRSVSRSFKRARPSTQRLLSEQPCDDMNELDAPLFPAHPPVKITTALKDSCSSELDAAVLPRQDERIFQVLDVDRAAAAAQRPGRGRAPRAAPTTHGLDRQGRSGGGGGGGGAGDTAG